VVRCVRGSDEHDNRDVERGQVLLLREWAIDGEQHIEPRRNCQSQQLTVALARPTHLGHSPGVVTRQLVLQPTRHALVKQDAHGR
jgi:hypothetical protein